MVKQMDIAMVRERIRRRISHTGYVSAVKSDHSFYRVNRCFFYTGKGGEKAHLQQGSLFIANRHTGIFPDSKMAVDGSSGFNGARQSDVLYCNGMLIFLPLRILYSSVYCNC